MDLSPINGKKTYAVAALVGVGAALLFLFGAADAKELLVGLLSSFALAAVRHAIGKLPTEAREQLERVLELLQSIRTQLPPAEPTEPPDRTPPPRILSGLVLALALSRSAAASEVAITGPTAVPVAGFPCTLFLEGELPAGSTIGWTVTPRNGELKQIQPEGDGKAAKLTTMAGTWNICAAIHEPDRPIYFRFYTVTVPGDPYKPPPGPTPPAPSPPAPPAPTPPPGPVPPPPVVPTPPGPTPPVPDPLPNRFGLRAKAADVVRLITSPNKATEARCLADGLKAIAEQIRDGKLAGTQAIVVAIGAALDRCTSTAWDTSREGLAAFIEALIRSGQLNTADDWRQAVLEAEAGLRDAI